jgi:hypothetical protein
MNTQPMNQKDPQTSIEQRLRTMRTLWIGMLGSVGLYYVFTLFRGRSEDVEPNDKLSLILIAVALLTTLASFFIKSKLVARAVDQRQALLVQQGYIVAWAVAEFAALLGMLDFFLTAHPHYYILFIIAALGLLLHFPRREHVVNASFKGSML